jgi:hypothetical protein
MRLQTKSQTIRAPTYGRNSAAASLPFAVAQPLLSAAGETNSRSGNAGTRQRRYLRNPTVQISNHKTSEPRRRRHILSAPKMVAIK